MKIIFDGSVDSGTAVAVTEIGRKITFLLGVDIPPKDTVEIFISPDDREYERFLILAAAHYN